MTTKPEAPTVLPIRQVVLECVQEFHGSNKVSSVERVSQATGFRLAQVTEAFNDLVDTKKLVRIGRGLVEPTQTQQSRPVSATTFDKNQLKLEVGDQTLHISRAEGRDVARLLCGLLVGFEKL